MLNSITPNTQGVIANGSILHTLKGFIRGHAVVSSCIAISALAAVIIMTTSLFDRFKASITPNNTPTPPQNSDNNKNNTIINSDETDNSRQKTTDLFTNTIDSSNDNKELQDNNFDEDFDDEDGDNLSLDCGQAEETAYEGVPAPELGLEIGSGDMGSVREDKNNPKLVVKVAWNGYIQSLINEYNIGNYVNHPNMVKFIDYKQYGTQAHLIMERVQGERVYPAKNPLERNQLLGVLTEASLLMGHLFDKGVVWADVNDGNVFTENGHLKLIDFGTWYREEDLSKLALGLLVGGIEIVNWLIKGSFIRQSEPNRAEEDQILFPRTFFDSIDATVHQQVRSKNYYLTYSQENWYSNFGQKLAKCNGNKVEIKKLLNSYFAHVMVNVGNLK